MRRTFVLFLLFFFTGASVYSQISAITNTGDEVILYDDGTWEYVKEQIESQRILINNRKFEKSESSTFLVESKKLNIGIWIDPKMWKFSKDKQSEVTELFFEHRKKDLYGMLITEKIQIPVEKLRGIALENARSAAPDTKVVKEEYRMVNDTKVLMMQMIGTIQGIKFTYYGYYYSNKNGTVQLVSYTGQNLFEEYKNDIEVFLNGFVET